MRELSSAGSRLQLPGMPGALIGRAADVARAKECLLREDVRLLTLVGTAGTGKTRLAVEVANQIAEHFADGVWFVDLAPVRDPELVPSALAETLDVREDGDRRLIEALKQHLASRSALLLLDNFEQVLPAAPYLADLLRACPALKLLVTSRSALHLQWEHELVVDPLKVPDLAALPTAASLAEVASVALLLERTQRIDSEFRLDESNAREVAEICVRLDGLPLAIELAAARMRVLPPRALLSRLGRRQLVLDGGPRDQPARQRTLGAALDWSYELLSPAEQALFRRLGVFVGGFTLEAVAEVCDPDATLGIDPVWGVESLIEKSLVRIRHTQTSHRQDRRFGLLETIRDYALEKLEAHDEAALMHRRHAEYYLGSAEVVVGQISTARQAAWLHSLELEHENLRAALAWCHEAREPELGLRAAGLLAWFWKVRGHISEGRVRLAELLALAGSSPAPLRAESLRVAASLALSQSDDCEARALFEASLTIRRALSDPAGLLGPLSGLGYTALRLGQNDTAQACFEEALAIQQRLGDSLGMAESLNSLANLAHGRGDLAAARALYEQSAALNRKVGYRLDVVEHNLGVVAEEQGDLPAAQQHFEASVAGKRALDDTPGLALSLTKLGEVIASQGDMAAAQPFLAESVVLQRELGDRAGLAFVLERLAMVSAMHGLPERALRLADASRALRAEVAALAWQPGRPTSAERAVTLALEPVRAPVHRPDRAPTPRRRVKGQLTRREREVAVLVARGFTNRQIAGALVISERTADVHVSNILNKLTQTSRAQLAAWAVRHGLLE